MARNVIVFRFFLLVFFCLWRLEYNESHNHLNMLVYYTMKGHFRRFFSLLSHPSTRHYHVAEEQ